MNNWKPISTAPKDGGEDHIFLIVYLNKDGEKEVCKGGFDNYDSCFSEYVDRGENNDGYFWTLPNPATHWQEIPEWPLPPLD